MVSQGSGTSGQNKTPRDRALFFISADLINRCLRWLGFQHGERGGFRHPGNTVELNDPRGDSKPIFWNVTAMAAAGEFFALFIRWMSSGKFPAVSACTASPCQFFPRYRRCSFFCSRCAPQALFQRRFRGPSRQRIDIIVQMY